MFNYLLVTTRHSSGVSLQHQVAENDAKQVVFLKNKPCLLDDQNMNSALTVTTITESPSQALYLALSKVGELSLFLFI